MKIKTKKELKENNLEPVKHRGQNFLISEEFLKKIIDSAKLKKGETVLEVGPGTGNLTEVLIETGVNIIAIEKDKNLADLLKLKMKNEKLKIVEADILKFDESAIAENYKIVANIPYYLTGQLIQKFLLSSNPPQKMILMVQKEVGERITANPPRTSYLSSLIQYLGQTKLLFGVGKENFWPVPKVDSVIIQITPQRIADPGQAERVLRRGGSCHRCGEDRSGLLRSPGLRAQGDCA